MDVRIGILNSPRELNFESSLTRDELEDLVGDALANTAGLLTLNDDKGNRYLVPTAGIAYVEIGTDQSRRVGFVA